MNVKEHVNNNQKVHFQFYRQGVLYYKTDKGLLFEVPISECDDACFNNEDRAMPFMKWIRAQLKRNEEGMRECGIIEQSYYAEKGVVVGAGQTRTPETLVRPLLGSAYQDVVQSGSTHGWGP